MKESKNVGATMIKKAKEADIIKFIKKNHKGKIAQRSHIDRPDLICYRSTDYDSLVFYKRKDGFWYYKRQSNGEGGDTIEFLKNYLGYSFKEAVRSLYYFVTGDPMMEEEQIATDEEDIFEKSMNDNYYNNKDENKSNERKNNITQSIEEENEAFDFDIDECDRGLPFS